MKILLIFEYFNAESHTDEVIAEKKNLKCCSSDRVRPFLVGDVHYDILIWFDGAIIISWFGGLLFPSNN